MPLSANMQLTITLLSILVLVPGLSRGEAPGAAFAGTWVVNEELSDDTDKQVEKAIKAAGGKVTRTKKKR